MNKKVKVGLTGVVHPNMPGNDKKIYQQIVKDMKLLSNEKDFDLVTIPEVLESEKASRKGKEKLEDNNVDFTMIFSASLGYGRVLLPLAKIDSYIGLWSIPEPTKSGVLQLNSFCGTNMFAAILKNYFKHYDIPYKWFYGYPESDIFMERFEITLRAMKAIKVLENSRIGLVGDIADGFENFNFDERLLDKKLGTYIQQRHTVEDIVARAKDINKEQVDKDLEEFLEMGNWNKDRVSEEDVRKSSRVYLAFKEFANENDYNALAISCWPKFQEVYDLAVCSAMSRLNQDGIVAPCEGDIMGTLNMLVLNAMSGNRATINDLVSIDQEDESFNFWHCGVAPACWANKNGVTWDQHFNIGEYKENGEWDGKGVVADLTFKPGPITVFRMDNNFDDLLIMKGEVMADKDSFYGSSGWVKNLQINGNKLSTKDLINTLIVNHVDHHFPTVYGDFTDELMEFANWKSMSVLNEISYKPYFQRK